MIVRQSRSTKTLSRHAPLPSMLIAILASCKAVRKATEVNWLPLIRVHDFRPTMPSQGFAQRLQARLRLQRHREPPSEPLAAEPVDNRHQRHAPPRAMGPEVMSIAQTWFGWVTATCLNRYG